MITKFARLEFELFTKPSKSDFLRVHHFLESLDIPVNWGLPKNSFVNPKPRNFEPRTSEHRTFKPMLSVFPPIARDKFPPLGIPTL
jgi:hypothetical protein